MNVKKTSLVVIGFSAIFLSGCHVNDSSNFDLQMPVNYVLHKNDGNNAFKNQNYTLAAKEYKKALNITLPHQSNYELNYNLGAALCNNGKTEEGIKKLTEFKQTSMPLLAMAPCLTVRGYSSNSFYACAGGLNITKKEYREHLQKQIDAIPELIQQCKTQKDISL